MKDWKDKFIIYVIIALMFVAFIFVVKGLDNEQPSAADVMTNNATTLDELLER